MTATLTDPHITTDLMSQPAPEGAGLSLEEITSQANDRLRDTRKRHLERAKGLTQLLGWLGAFPGDDWQQRWEAAGCEQAGMSWGQQGLIPYRKSLQGSAVIALVVLGVIRPSMHWLRTATPPHMFIIYRNVVDTEAFALLDAQLDTLRLSKTSKMMALNALTLLRIRIGTPLLQISASQFLSVESEWKSLRRTRSVGVAWQTLQACVAGLLIGMPWFFQRSLIYFPDRGQPRPAAELLPGAQEVTLTTSDDLELGAWYLPAADGCRATVLVAPGNGGNRANRAGLGRAISELGFGVLLFDYRGYAANPGYPSEDGLARDVRAAREFLTGAAGVPAGSLVYFGESIGAGVVTELATEHPPAAMLLRSPFTSLADLGRAAYGVPVGWMLRDHYPVRENVVRADIPTAVVYGSADTIVPAQQSRDVAQAARDAGNYVIEVE